MVADGESGSNGAFLSVPVGLDVALDVLGDWGSDGNWLARLPASPASPLLASVDAEANQKQTDYRRKRDARDAKRTALKAQVTDLTHTLQQEKERFPECPSPLLADDVNGLSREWAKMARRQRRQRTKVEKDHETLQEAYQSQLKFAKQIDRRLHKALAIGRGVAPASETVTMTDYRGPRLNVAAHMAYLDMLHGHANAVLSCGPFHEVAGQEFRRVRYRDIGIEGIQVEFTAEWVLPFAVHKVANAVWHEITRMEHEGRQVDHEHAMASASVLVTSFVSAPALADDIPGSNHGQVIHGITHGQTALRRFEPHAADGSVWLLAMNHGRILDKNEKIEGFLRGDGWICVVPEKNTNCSRIKWCHRVSGRPSGYEAASPDERARWTYSSVTRAMRSHWERTLESTLQAIENALVLAAAQEGRPA